MMITLTSLISPRAVAWVEDPDWPESSEEDSNQAVKFVGSDDWRLRGAGEALGDDDAHVVALAIDLLAAFRSPSGIDQILKRLRSDPDLVQEPAVTSAVAHAFSAVHSAPQAEIDFLVERLRDDPNPEIRKAAILALATFEGAATSAIPSLMRCREKENYLLRGDCESALMKIRVADDGTLSHFLAELDKVQSPSNMGYEFLLCSPVWNSADVFSSVADEAKPRIADDLDVRLRNPSNPTALSATLQAWAALNYYKPIHLEHLLALLKRQDTPDNAWIAYSVGIAAAYLHDSGNLPLNNEPIAMLSKLAAQRQHPSNALPSTINPYLFALIELGGRSATARQVATDLMASKSVVERSATLTAAQSHGTSAPELIPVVAASRYEHDFDGGCVATRALARRYPKSAAEFLQGRLKTLPPEELEEAQYCEALAKIELHSESDGDVHRVMSHSVQTARYYANVPSVLELLFTAPKVAGALPYALSEVFNEYFKDYGPQSCQTVLEDNDLWRIIKSMAEFGQDAWALNRYRKQLQPVLLRLLTQKCSNAPLNNEQRKELAIALSWFGKLSFDQAVPLLAVGFQSPEAIPDMRFWTTFLTGGDTQIQLAARWLNGGAADLPVLSSSDAAQLIRVFTLVLGTEPTGALRVAALAKLLQVVRNTTWSFYDSEELKSLRKSVLQYGGHEKPRTKVLTESIVVAIDQTLSSIERQKTIRSIGIDLLAGVVGYSIVWLLTLVFFYPRLEAVQSLLVWNKSLRKISSLWYLQALILTSARLRNLIVEPFRDRLMADADLDSFESAAFYEHVQFLLGTTSLSLEDLQAIPGTLILEGVSGTGKTTVLRALALRTKDNAMCVYLKAAKCSKGVVNAVRERLDVLPSDADFVRQLLHVGAVHVFIDGLNEAPLTVAEAVRSFIDENRNVRVVVSMQPIRWEVPSRARVVRLAPLDSHGVEEFLLKRCEGDTLLGPIRDRYYENLRAYVAEVQAKSGQPEYAMLIRPINLTIASSLLQRGEMPSLYRLQDQVIDRAAAQYETHKVGAKFPRPRLEEAAFSTLERIGGDIELEEEILEYLLPDKFVIKRFNADDKGEWRFAHETIASYLASAVFAPERKPPFGRTLWASRYFDDPRFRTVFLMLASNLDPEDADRLGYEIHMNAIATGDHSLSDDYYRILSSRPAVSGSERDRLTVVN